MIMDKSTRIYDGSKITSVLAIETRGETRKDKVKTPPHMIIPCPDTDSDSGHLDFRKMDLSFHDKSVKERKVHTTSSVLVNSDQSLLIKTECTGYIIPISIITEGSNTEKICISIIPTMSKYASHTSRNMYFKSARSRRYSNIKVFRPAHTSTVGENCRTGYSTHNLSKIAYAARYSSGEVPERNVDIATGSEEIIFPYSSSSEIQWLMQQSSGYAVPGEIVTSNMSSPSLNTEQKEVRSSKECVEHRTVERINAIDYSVPLKLLTEDTKISRRIGASVLPNLIGRGMAITSHMHTSLRKEYLPENNEKFRNLGNVFHKMSEKELEPAVSATAELCTSILEYLHNRGYSDVQTEIRSAVERRRVGAGVRTRVTEFMASERTRALDLIVPALLNGIPILEMVGTASSISFSDPILEGYTIEQIIGYASTTLEVIKHLCTYLRDPEKYMSISSRISRLADFNELEIMTWSTGFCYNLYMLENPDWNLIRRILTEDVFHITFDSYCIETKLVQAPIMSTGETCEVGFRELKRDGYYEPTECQVEVHPSFKLEFQTRLIGEIPERRVMTWASSIIQDASGYSHVKALKLPVQCIVDAIANMNRREGLEV